MNILKVLGFVWTLSTAWNVLVYSINGHVVPFCLAVLNAIIAAICFHRSKKFDVP